MFTACPAWDQALHTRYGSGLREGGVDCRGPHTSEQRNQEHMLVILTGLERKTIWEPQNLGFNPGCASHKLCNRSKSPNLADP